MFPLLNETEYILHPIIISLIISLNASIFHNIIRSFDPLAKILPL